MPKTIQTRYAIFAVLIAVLITFLACRGVEDPDSQNLSIEFPGVGKIDLKSTRQGLNHEALLKQLFSKEFSRNGVLGWLRENQRLYSLDSTELAEAINTKLCDPIPETPPQEQLAKRKECASKPNIVALRQLSHDHRIPFHYVGDKVPAGVQKENDHRPGVGRVNVCREGNYVGQKLEIMDPNLNKKIEVEARGTYQCTVGIFPYIQLDPDDAYTLFGRPTDKYEDVIVVVL